MSVLHATDEMEGILEQVRQILEQSHAPGAVQSELAAKLLRGKDVGS